MRVKMLHARIFLQSSNRVWPWKTVLFNRMYGELGGHTRSWYAEFCTSSELSEVHDSPSSVESPALPDWIKFCENEKSNVESDDDFVLPNVSGWANTQKLHDDHSKHVKCMVHEIVDSDVERLTQVLKGKFESLDAVCDSLAVFGDINLSESLVEKVLLRFNNDWMSAFGFFKWAKHQNVFLHSRDCYDMMVDILGKSRNFEVMWELIEEMDNLGRFVSSCTLTKVMRRLSKAQKYDNAIEAFRKFEKFGLIKETSAMNILMDSLVKGNSVEHADKVLLEFKDVIPPNTATFNILIHGWCKAKKYDDARKVMEQMEMHGCYPDVASYTSFVEYHCHQKDFRKVREILDEMQQKGCFPNVVTYTIIILALGKANDVLGSLEFWENMKTSGCTPDASVYGALIFVLSKSGRFKDARDLFEDMSQQNITPNLFAYNSMISAACMHSSEEYALELLHDMEEKSCRPDLKTYAPLLKLGCRKKRMKLINYLLCDMFRKNVSIDLGTYSLLVNSLCKNGKLEHACSFFEQMVLKGMVPKESIYKSLMEKLEEKRMQKAKQLIEQLMSKAKILTSERDSLSLQLRTDEET